VYYIGAPSSSMWTYINSSVWRPPEHAKTNIYNILGV
jgi:hypothetical protein